MEESNGSEEDSENEELRKEMEIALYSQIHFLENQEYTSEKQNETCEDYKIDIIGDVSIGFKAKHRTSDILLNRSIDCVVSDDDNEAISISSKKSDDIGLETPHDLKDADSDIDSLCGVLDEDHVEDLPGLKMNITRNQRPLIETNPDEAEKWRINVDDRRHGKGVFRYHKGYRCNNCNEIGHLSKNCPKPKKVTVCGFCSEPGHFMMKCPSSLCYNCYGMGHDARKCQRPKKSTHNKCHRCAMVGHNQSDCPDQWRQYHHTISPGKIIQGLSRETSFNYCYNCGGEDHLGYECDEERMSRYVRVTVPFICRYDRFPSYNIDREGPDEPPRKRQKTEANPKSSKKPSQYVIGKTNRSDSTGRNNFDKLMSDKPKGTDKKTKKKRKNKKQDNTEESNSKITKKKKKNKKKDNTEENDSKITKKRNRVEQKVQFVEEEDFPRNNNNNKLNDNGFRSRFANLGSDSKINDLSNISITVNQLKDNLPAESRTVTNIELTDCVDNKLSKKKRRSKRKRKKKENLRSDKTDRKDKKKDNLCTTVSIVL